MLLNKNTYLKTYCFLSSKHQEKIINSLEQKFYEAIKLLRQDTLPNWYKKSKLSSVLTEIDETMHNLYFSNEYKIYLESLHGLAFSYLESLRNISKK